MSVLLGLFLSFLMLSLLAVGGQLVAPVGGSGSQSLVRLVKREDGSVEETTLAPVVFDNIEFVYVTPLDDITGGTGADNLGRFLLFKHDPFENNNSRFVATHLGVGETLNVDPTIDPGAGALGAACSRYAALFLRKVISCLYPGRRSYNARR